jgi:hypothetical protein
MADTVTSQIINDGPKNYVVRLLNLSDGTGENNVKKVDISTVTFPLNASNKHLILLKYNFSTFNMGVILKWEASVPTQMMFFPPNWTDEHDYTDHGGIPNDGGTGKTGSVLLSTLGVDGGTSTINGARYDITLWFRKHWA